MLSDSEAATPRYAWQAGSPASRRRAMATRREELLAVDMATDRRAQEEWIALLMERQSGQEEELAEETAAAEAAALEAQGPPPLRGWLDKQGAKGPVRTFRQRWFEYNDATGRLYYFKTRGDEEPRGFVDLTTLQSITTTDPGGRRFRLITPERTWVLLAEDEQTMITWMDELHYRKSLLPAHAGAGSGGFVSSHAAEEEYAAAAAQGGEGNGSGGPAPDDEAFPASGAARRRYENAPPPSPLDADLVAGSRSAAFGATTTETEEAGTAGAAAAAAGGTEANAKVSVALSELEQLRSEGEVARRELKDMRRQLRLKTEAAALMQGELIAGEREAALKDQALRHLRARLEEEEAARQKQLRHGLSAQELQVRLVYSQSELAHTRALLDLFNQRIAGAMEQIAYYKAAADGAVGTADGREDVWLAQLATSQQACAASEERNAALQEEVEQLRGQLRDARLA